MQRTRTLVLAAAAFAAALALGGCTATPSSSSSSSDDAEDASPSPTVAAAELATADSSLGTIVVDADGRSVYVFDKDTAGATTSACTGQCAAAWPAVETDSDSPAVDGVTGTIGTIAAADGRKQVTLNGLPLYYFAQDAAAGDVKGQGVNGIWWVLDASGAKVSTAAAASSTGY